MFGCASAWAGPPERDSSYRILTGNLLNLDPKRQDDEKAKSLPNQDRSSDEKDKEKDKDKDKDKKDEPTWYSMHGQATVVNQGNFPFHAPYAGPNSLISSSRIDSTATATLFLASRLPWQGGEIVFNPEVAGGTGLSSTTGMAGFPNGEATRTGLLEPTPYIARLFIRQVFGLGGGTEEVPDGVNQVAGTRDRNRLTFQLGKMAAPDIIGDNPYSHDPRTQFLNWSLMFNGAWDYPANVRGYTYGGTVELTLGDWAFTYGVFGEPAEANGADIDPRILNAQGHVVEIEKALILGDRPGKIRIIPFLNRANMGNYREALALSPVNPDIMATRSYRMKYGVFVNYEQELTDTLSLIARAGWNNGQSETWAFTEIDQTAVLGLLIKGTEWGRPADRVGIAGVMNGLSNAHRDYLAAGGVGFIVGDGQLRYSPESILEMYYNCQLREGLFVTLDFQGVLNPAYNRDRGPVGILGLRTHFEF
ncbi:MAG: carbohydrate porin [Gemmataceae bacterium]